MRKLFLVMIFGLISTFIYAAPFGLKMGMTVEEIAEQCEEEPSYFEDAHLVLYYYFKNASAVEDEQDEVF